MTVDGDTLDGTLERLLGVIRHVRGVDLTECKRDGLVRRIQRRIDTLHLDGFEAYEAHLAGDADEFGLLFDSVFVNVTAFFRDAETWGWLVDEGLPSLLARRGADDVIRVWSVGCATGEETYTVAMVLAEALGADAFHRRVKIYGTDVDLGALAIARAATYPAKRVRDGVPDELVHRYFSEAGDDTLAVRRELRRAVVFGHHDVLGNSPISRLDLLLCRNVLMYLQPDAQGRALRSFAYALEDGGLLVLGRSESVASRTGAFQPVDLRRRIFTPVPGPRRRPVRPRQLLPTSIEDPADAMATSITEQAYEVGAVAQVLLAPDGTVLAVNAQARDLFHLGPADIGRAFRDLELSYRPVELRSLIEEAAGSGQTVAVPAVEWPRAGGAAAWFDVHIAPLGDATGASVGTSITFTESTIVHRLQVDLETSRTDLETAYEELQSAVEELETTNEELQSTNEELETTNEELQSANEELETMNEELQSANAELEAVNDELRLQTAALDDARSFVETVLGSLPSGIVVLDHEMRILVWNSQAHELWGVRADEVRDEHLMNIDIGLPVDKLHQPLRAALQAGDADEVELDAVNRRGRAVRCRVRMCPLRQHGTDVTGVILLMDALPA